MGEINEASFLDFSRKVGKLERAGQGDITVILCSNGGEDSTALAFYDRIRCSDCVIRVIALGSVMSAATVILAAGDQRLIGPNCWVMFHDSSDKVTGSVGQLEHHVKRLTEIEDQWAAILASRSNLDAPSWRTISKRTTFLTAQQALQYGLVDAIMEPKE